MSYSKHNFIPGDVLRAKPLNEMDNQIYENSEKISQVDNTSETPVTSGKVWTSTEDGAVWADPKNSVSSVNGKTGAVTLTAKDVKALPDSTEIPVVPTDVSAFENDAGYLTEQDIEDNLLYITELKKDLSSLITRLQSGSIENAGLHLGFYLDENGDLCQKEE